MIKKHDELAYVIRHMPDSCTQPAYDFAMALVKLIRFSDTQVVALVRQRQTGKRPTIVAAAVDFLAESSKDIRGLLSAELQKDGYVTTVSQQRLELPEEIEVSQEDIEANLLLLSELLLCRVTDKYLAYLTTLLTSVYIGQPHLLKSGDQVSYEYILQYSTMEELIAALLEKRINELSYKGFRDFVQYCCKQGIQLFDTNEQLNEVNYFIEVRNLLVHNNGVVNNIFKTRLPNLSVRIGDNISEDEQFHKASETFAMSVFDIDNRISDKFKLPLVRLRQAS